MNARTSSGKPLRILQVGLGPLGVRTVADLHERGLGEVVAAVDIDPTLVGRSIALVVAGASKRVRVADGLEALPTNLRVDAAIVTTASDLRACAPTLHALLARGLPVVTTCEEAIWPFLRHPALARELDAVARKHGGRLVGTGVNPGYLMDAVPVFATAVSRRVDSIEIHRFQDATTRRVPFQKKIGATLTPAAFKAGVKAGWLRHVGLGESLHLVAAAMGWKIDTWRESIRPVIASRRARCALGTIQAGAALGVHQEATGASGGKRVLKFVFEAAIGLPDPHDRVLVRGEPDLDLRFAGGVHGDVATSSITLNAIRPLMASAPGLHTMLSLPLVHWDRGR